jgi:hypothetical protein
MADRLQELLQQRALIKEHLEWLDAEIAAYSGRTGDLRPPAATRAAAPVAAPAPVPTFSSARTAAPEPARVPIAAVAAPLASHTPDEAEALIAKLAAEENTQPVPTKQGCWISFLAVLLVAVVGAWILLHYLYRG